LIEERSLGQKLPKAQKVKRIMEIFSFDANDTPLASQSADENDPANQRSAHTHTHTEGKVKRICAYKKENFHYAVSPCVVCSAPSTLFVLSVRARMVKKPADNHEEREHLF
jgi:predicted house-cleaning NTP pyrophosphatase (Maf/HAM1 superfamily)